MACHTSGMRTNVSTLLREFPKVRRASIAGEEVIIVTREGDLRLTAEARNGVSILGNSKTEILVADDDIDQPTTTDADWKSSENRYGTHHPQSSLKYSGIKEQYPSMIMRLSEL